jgi:hypothetical protein
VYGRPYDLLAHQHRGAILIRSFGGDGHSKSFVLSGAELFLFAMMTLQDVTKSRSHFCYPKQSMQILKIVVIFKNNDEL